jgi:Tfp pilus assembly protein PilV
MRRRGLSFIEILVSAIIMALIMTGLANIFAASKRHILRSRSRITAAELSRHFLDLLHMDVRQDQWGSNCVSNNNFCSTWNTTSVYIDGYTYTPAYTSSAVGTSSARKIRLNITWNETTF